MIERHDHVVRLDKKVKSMQKTIKEKMGDQKNAEINEI